MQKKKNFIRYFIIAAFFIIMVFIYGGRLLNMQIANADQFHTAESEVHRIERFAVPAVRGEIFDRHGVPLVTNRLIHSLTINGARFPAVGNLADTEYIINLVRLIKLYGDEIVPHGLPVLAIENANGTWSYSYSTARSQNTQFDGFLSANNMSQHISADALVNWLATRYRLNELMPHGERDHELFMAVLGTIYDLDRRRIIEQQNPFIISVDISEPLIKAVRENAHNYPGVEVTVEYRRVHHFPHSAPHLIGRIGRIQEHQWERFRELGYPMDAIIGQNGVEAAFEHFLRGWDGVRVREFDRYGNIINERYARDSEGNEMRPVPGKNVYLTLDIKMQQVAEHSVRQTIERIHGLSNDGFGADASAGTAAIINLTGEVLALPTYPSYNLATFNEDWEELRDHPGSPMLNRALSGEYAPGSVFKIATTVAALSSGAITTDERISCRGRFTRFDDYQPICWIFRRGWTHGSINVTQALQVSCNYFYFAVGERMAADNDIALLNSYVRRMGLGVHTGIEVGGTRGVIASRANSEARAAAWHPGNTLAAAIGQGDYAFSPIQMATMLGTVLNGGTRYETRLLLYVKEYGSDEIYYAPAPVVADAFEIEPEQLHAIKTGMRDVFDVGGTGAILFSNLPGLTTGGKTGTAEVPQGSPNANIVTFAPFAEPELVMSVVIENGAMGTWAGFVSEDVFAYHFGYVTFDEALGLLDEPEYDSEEESEENGGDNENG